MINQYIDFLAEELMNEKLVIFVGAGASVDSGLPTWNELIKKFAEKLRIPKTTFNTKESLDIPETFLQIFWKSSIL